MKKLVLVLGLVAVFALVNVASAATLAELQASLLEIQAAIDALSGTSAAASNIPTITKSLTLGSAGDEVSALQMYLEDEGLLEMPAGVDYGYFGPLTKAAVVEWQKANDVSPASGYFGPISRGVLADLAAAAPAGGTLPAGCTAGAIASTITGLPCVATALPAGCSSTAGYSSTVVGLSCASGGIAPVVGLDNTDGSITATDAAFVSSGATFKKGETRNIYDVDLQATGGKVAVTRLDVKFSERPWLTLSKLVLKDSTGTVIAEKALSSSADATEVIVGSDYRVRFDNFNYVVAPGADATLVVSATSMAASDKISTQTVTVSIPASAIRTVNGKGYSESIGTITAKTFTFSSTGSVADLFSSVSPNTPAKRNVTTSSSETPDIVLGVYRLKAVNADATISSLAVAINRSTSAATSTLLTNLRLIDGSGKEYGASSLTASPTFSNMSTVLTKDVWQDFTLKATINASQNLSASTTLDVSSIVGIDSNFNTLTLTNASDINTNDIVFSSGALELVSPSATLGPVIKNGMCVTTPCDSGYNTTFVFTLKNISNGVLYASTTMPQLVSTSSTGSITGANVSSSTMQSLSASGDTGNDTTTNYYIPSGVSRTFTMTGVIGDIGPATQYSELKITGINYSGASGGATAGTIDFGLTALKVGATF